MVSSNIRDMLVEKTAVELKQPEQVVEKVVSFQFKHAAAATHVHSEIEISGFGKFQISQAKVKKRIQHLEVLKPRMEGKLITLQGPQKDNYEQKLESLKSTLSFMYGKLK